MENFLQYIIILALLLYHPASGLSQEVDPKLFQPSRMVSAEISKKQLKKIYLAGSHTQTLHCGCYFDKLKQVFSTLCEQAPRQPGMKKKPKILEWVHAVPITVFANPLNCWKKKSCTRVGRTGLPRPQCCREISPKFKTREADMHNLFPAIVAEQTEPRPGSKSAWFGGMEEYRFCSEENKAPSEPRTGVRGDFARAYFYMAYQYRIPIPGELEDRLRMWHLNDPPGRWEEERNSLIEIVQGNRNPFIDHPELVERVRDF